MKIKLHVEVGEWYACSSEIKGEKAEHIIDGLENPNPNAVLALPLQDGRVSYLRPEVLKNAIITVEYL